MPLTAKSPKAAYKDLIKLNSSFDNEGLSNSSVNICAGDGNNTFVKISSESVYFADVGFFSNNIMSFNTDEDIVLSPNGLGFVLAPSGYDMSTGPNYALATKIYVDVIPKSYLLMGSFNGTPTSSQRIFSHIASQNFTLPQNLTGSYGVAKVSSTAQTDFDIKVNTVNKGIMRFGASESIATFVFADAVNIVPGDVIEIISPSSSDATLSDLSWTIGGTII